jgi:phosphatidylserine decarboxylase
MMAVANGYNKTNHSFESFFKCNPAQPNLGFRSWDDFFARHIADMNALRPVASPQDDNVIASACEAIPFAIATGIKPRDDFWIKEQRYSVVDMLDDAAAAERFAGGTVYQGLLLSLAYHRWHAPVAGVVRSARVVDGTYYSTPMFTSPGEDGSGVRMEEFEHVVYAQGYMAHRATRAVIMIDAHNAAIGTVAFVAVGMLEVSSCEITVKEGERIAKGQDMGSFHFGGSSHCLVFGKHVRLEGLPGVGADASVAVRSKLAEVVVGV